MHGAFRSHPVPKRPRHGTSRALRSSYRPAPPTCVPPLAPPAPPLAPRAAASCGACCGAPAAACQRRAAAPRGVHVASRAAAATACRSRARAAATRAAAAIAPWRTCGGLTRTPARSALESGARTVATAAAVSGSAGARVLRARSFALALPLAVAGRCADVLPLAAPPPGSWFKAGAGAAALGAAALLVRPATTARPP